jgi:DNA-binding transcriptional ArsR family regulator
MKKYPKLKDELLITNPETLKVIAHPLRLQILKTFKSPKTVKEVAEIIDMAQTKLYYHVNMMEKHNLIEVVETDIVSGIIEKKYRVTAAQFSVDDTLLSTGPGVESQVDILLGAVFDSAKNEIKKSVQANLMDLKDDSDATKGIIVNSSISLTDQQAKEFNKKISAVFNEYQKIADQTETAAPNAPIYGLTYAFFPVYRSENE